jgi:hypothetical protein
VLQVVTILVKGDTVDVNVAGIQRMSPQAWAAAADIFRRELAGVQFLQQQQVRAAEFGASQQQCSGGRSLAAYAVHAVTCNTGCSADIRC